MDAKKRIVVQKTYKLYIGGKFPRTESGRFDQVELGDGSVANVCRGSRKDVRNAIVAARAAQAGWSKRTAYNRSQIIYRIAEMLEGRRSQFIDELINLGQSENKAKDEVGEAIDLLVYYAGWCDKYQQIFSSVNPVAAPYFNFSVPEPTGIVTVLAPADHSLLGLLNMCIPAIAGGNTIVALASKENAIPAISLAEVIHTSDVPAGVINMITGRFEELYPHFASHMDVNAVVVGSGSDEQFSEIKKLAANNVKRVFDRRAEGANAFAARGPYPIMQTQEIKTTWHPVGR